MTAETELRCATCGRPIRKADRLHAGGWRHDNDQSNAAAEWCETAYGYVRVALAKSRPENERTS